jgi:hypothetical protein
MEILQAKIRSEAISVFIYGFDIFIPKKRDQILMLECLVNKKKHGIMEKTVENNCDFFSREFAKGFSLFEALSGLSREGSDALLLSVLERTALPGNAWEYVPLSLRNNGSDPISCPTLPPLKSNSELENSSVTYNKSRTSLVDRIQIGDVVVIGPDWMYGQQDMDGSSGDQVKRTELSDLSAGYVIDISPWVTDGSPRGPVLSPLSFSALRELGGDSAQGGRPDNRDECGLCVTVQWPHGAVNSYRWGVPTSVFLEESLPTTSQPGVHSDAESSDRNAPLATSGDVESKGPRSLSVRVGADIINVVRRYYDLRTVYSESSPAPVVGGKREVLKYTPGQVHESLIRGLGDIQPGDVLLYLEEKSSVRSERGIPGQNQNQSVGLSVGGNSDIEEKENEGVSGKEKDKLKEKGKGKEKEEKKNAKLSPAEVYVTYEKYFAAHGLIISDDFSMFQNVEEEENILLPNIDMRSVTLSSAFSRLLLSLSQVVEIFHVSDIISKSTEKNSKDESSGTRILGQQESDNSMNAKINESTKKVLLIFQGLILGAGESTAGKNLSKIIVNISSMKDRLATLPFFGSEKIALQWNWTDGFWNTVPKESEKKKIRNQNLNSENREKILSNLYFDSALVPDSLVLTDSRRTVHQCWNRRWGTTLGSISCQPNTGNRLVLRAFYMPCATFNTFYCRLNYFTSSSSINYLIAFYSELQTCTHTHTHTHILHQHILTFSSPPPHSTLPYPIPPDPTRPH